MAYKFEGKCKLCMDNLEAKDQTASLEAVKALKRMIEDIFSGLVGYF